MEKAELNDVLQCYRELDLPPGATAQQVRKAYVALAQVWHPDRFIDNPVLRAMAAEKMKRVDAAYGVIGAFLPELNRLGQPQEETSSESTPEKVMDEAAGTDSIFPLRKVFLGILGAVVLLIMALGAVLFLKWRTVPVFLG
jgi:curved DNA-binding protein CbpA